jgi:hypothetical protein
MHPLILLAAAGGLAYYAKRKWLSNGDSMRTADSTATANPDVQTSSSDYASPPYGDRSTAGNDSWQSTPRSDPYDKL